LTYIFNLNLATSYHMKSHYGSLKFYHDKNVMAIKKIQEIKMNSLTKHVVLKQQNHSLNEDLKQNPFWPIKVLEKIDPIYTNISYDIHSLIYRN